jgi:tetratricopeptide (TPR) repeat protein
MLAILLLQAPAPPPQVHAQMADITVGEARPARLEALLKARDWPALADWFDTVPPQTRGAHYEWWLQSLKLCQRWARLLVVCEALQPQLEAKSGPRLGTYRLYRAQALTALGRHSEAALAHAENGRLGLPDGFPNACAEARFAQDWAALLGFAEEWLGKQPDLALGLAWRGEALSRLERHTEAEPVLRAALAKDPKIAYAWNNLGRSLNERKAWAEAAEALDRALELDPGQMEALFNRGRARFELRRYRDSRDDFRAALALKPDDPVLTTNLQQAERYALLPEPKKGANRKKR